MILPRIQKNRATYPFELTKVAQQFIAERPRQCRLGMRVQRQGVRLISEGWNEKIAQHFSAELQKQFRARACVLT